MIVARVENLHFTHGGAHVPALAGVSLQVRAGEIVLVEGPSGSGKSTLLRALCGLVPHFHGGQFRGSVHVCDNDTRTTSAAELARQVGCVFQDPETQAVRATVAADVAFGPENLGAAAQAIDGQVAEALRAVGGVHLADRAIGTLSGGERQRAALAAVLANRPRLLLLDEPTSQLDAAAVADLDAILRDQAARGVAVVVAEHHAHRLGITPDRTIHMAMGRVVACADHHWPGVDDDPPQPGARTLSVRGVHAAHGERSVLCGCDLQLDAGTITALHGANGSGKSTLLRVLAGLHPLTDGAVQLADRDITTLAPEARVPTVGFLPQDGGRRLIHERVDHELASALGDLSELERRRRVDQAARDLDLLGLLDRHPLDLSVGERERVALGAVLATEPHLILLDEPTRGMDPTHRAQVITVLRRRARAGACVLVATHDPQFAAAIADTHVALRDGRIVSDTARAVAV